MRKRLYTLSNTKTLFAVFVHCAWYLQLMQYIISSCTELNILPPSIRYIFVMQNLYAKESFSVSSIYGFVVVCNAPCRS